MFCLITQIIVIIMEKDLKTEIDYLSDYEYAGEDESNSSDSVSHERKMQNQCINCSTQLEQTDKFTIDIELEDLVKKWIAPEELLPEHVLCTVCWNLAQETINEEGSDEENESLLARKRKVCTCCGESTQNGRDFMYAIENQRDTFIWEDIVERIAPRVLNPNDKICSRCWGKSNRVAKSKLSDIETPVQSVSNVSKPETNCNIIMEGTITLPNYSRAPCSTVTCIYPDCKEKIGEVAAKSLRVQLLGVHKYYVHRRCRICPKHSNVTTDSLVTTQIRSFSADIIEDMLKIQQEGKFNFNNVESISDDLVFYWTGLHKHEFLKVLINVKCLNELEHGSLGLMAYFMKIHTGDDNHRIASLMNIPWQTLEELLFRVTELIDKAE